MPPEIDKPSRILMIRPSALGDVCRTVPVLASLAQAWPEAGIDWIVQEEFVDAVSAHPALQRVIPFPRRRFGRWFRSPRVARELFQWSRGLRRERYDLVLDCQGLGRSGYMARATRSPRRFGDRAAREMAWLAYTDRVDTSGIVHDVDRMLALLPACGAVIVPDMQLYVPGDDRRNWAEGEHARIASSRCAVLASTSRWVSKAWPREHWSTLAGHLLGSGFDHVLLVGSPSERDEVAALHDAIDGPADRVHNLAGSTSVGGLMAIIESAALTVSNDSAALHMAVGLGGRCVGLYGPTDPAKVGPYGMNDVVVRADVQDEGRVNYRDSSLGDRIMRRITVDDVVQRIETVLAARPEPA